MQGSSGQSAGSNYIVARCAPHDGTRLAGRGDLRGPPQGMPRPAGQTHPNRLWKDTTCAYMYASNHLIDKAGSAIVFSICDQVKDRLQC